MRIDKKLQILYFVKKDAASFRHPALDLKSKETVSFCTILVGCIENSAHPTTQQTAGPMKRV